MRKLEGPRLFGFNTCRQFIRAVAVLPRDEIDMGDVDTAAEGHVWEAGIRPRDERKRLVSQPLPRSLSLRNTGFWNQH